MTEQLLPLLRQFANSAGLVLVRAEILQEALDCSFDELNCALQDLSKAGQVGILTPLPFAVLALRSSVWSGRQEEVLETGRNSDAVKHRAYSFESSPSRSKLSKRLKESYRPSVLAEESPLLKEILDTLGETDPTTFRGAIRNYPAGAIRIALARVRTVKRVRKNRTALFRFLLPRIANETSSFH